MFVAKVKNLRLRLKYKYKDMWVRVMVMLYIIYKLRFNVKFFTVR